MDEEEAINADFRLKEMNIIKHNSLQGLTGLSIDYQRNNGAFPLMVALRGQSDKRFSQDLDNYLNIADVYNFIAGPLIDSKGQIRGVIQFINKDDNGRTQITEDDKKEISGILPILGEIMRTADESSEISEVSCSLH